MAACVSGCGVCTGCCAAHTAQHPVDILHLFLPCRYGPCRLVISVAEIFLLHSVTHTARHASDEVTVVSEDLHSSVK